MGWTRVCRVDELSESAAYRAEVGGRTLCFALADGAPVAVDDGCPHRDVSLSSGLARDGVVTCPGHFRRFDLRTGRCLSQPGESVSVYECAVVDGWVEVNLGPARPQPSAREMLLAHARARRERGSDAGSAL